MWSPLGKSLLIVILEQFHFIKYLSVELIDFGAALSQVNIFDAVIKQIAKEYLLLCWATRTMLFQCCSTVTSLHEFFLYP